MGNDKENQGIPKTFMDYDGTLRYFYPIDMVDRQYIFVDGLDRIIDFRVYKKEIDYLYEKGMLDYEAYPKRKSKYFRYRFDKNNYRFRQDPVPYTGNKCHSQYYRIPKLHNLYKQITEDEYQDLVRAKRNLNNLPNIFYDDPPLRSRYKSKSWKDCTKKRKQWM